MRSIACLILASAVGCASTTKPTTKAAAAAPVAVAAPASAPAEAQAAAPASAPPAPGPHTSAQPAPPSHASPQPAPAPHASPPPTPAPHASALPAPAAPTATAGAAPHLDLKGLEQRLKATKAIGVFTKLALKNQVDDLLARFRAYHGGRQPPTLTDLRPNYELLIMKVQSLIQDGDPALADDVAQSREAIWGVLADKNKFALI